jgi:hypothetical protein
MSTDPQPPATEPNLPTNTVQSNGRATGGCTGKGFKPGQSGNPSGRKRGFATRILELTDDGEELIQHALAVLRDSKASGKERAEARQWLSNYAIGKPVETHDMNVSTIVQERMKALIPYLDPAKKDELAQFLSSIELGHGRS